MSSVNPFSIGKSGLFTSKAALSTTAHNIANVNTEGYSRQRVDQETIRPSQLGNLVLGNGARLKQVHRINDEHLSRQIANESKFVGEFEEKDLALAQTENIFNEINNVGMNRLISKFFNEFRKLGNEPESQALRASVRENSDQLVGDFKRLSRSLNDTQRNIDIRIQANVNQVNDLAKKITELNQEIKRFEMGGGEAGDLRDARDLAVRKLSSIVDISVATNEKGDFTISIKNVGNLLTGVFSNKMEVKSSQRNLETGKPEGGLEVHLHGLLPPEITYTMKSGRLGGLIEARDSIIGKSRQRIDELAYVFSKKINEIHRQGYNLNNSTGVSFFKELDRMEDAAELLSLSKEVQADENNIATALAPDSPGDNRVVQLIGRLQTQRIMADGKSTFDDHYNATVADVASVTQKNKQSLEHQGQIVTQLDKLRESISGVSLDEETTNLVQFQHAFDASAKVIKVADEMLDTVLNLRR